MARFSGEGGRWRGGGGSKLGVQWREGRVLEGWKREKREEEKKEIKQKTDVDQGQERNKR